MPALHSHQITNLPTITTPPSPISLEGEWEVARIDIQYPHNWMNIAKDVYILFVFDTTNKEPSVRNLLIGVLSDYRIKYDKELSEVYNLLPDKGIKITKNELLMLCARIPKGYYANVGELITTLNQEIQDSFSGQPGWAKPEETKEVSLLYRFNTIERSVQGYQTGMVGLPEIICFEQTSEITSRTGESHIS